MPAADGGGDRGAVLEAELAQGPHRIRIVVRAGEDEAAAGPGESRGFLEQLGVMVLDIAEMVQQRLGERRAVRMAAEAGDRLQLLAGGGQGLGLAVVDHLQPVLDMAQIAIGGDHRRAGGRCDAAGGDQGVDRLAGRRRAQLGLAAAPDQLLGLGEELDLADAAAAQLDVVAGDGDLAMALHRLDLALDGMDVLDRGEIEILAPDEGAQMAQEFRPRLRIAGDGARLDHGGAFPILPHALVIGLGGEHRHGERRRARIGTQPQIGAEDIAVLRMVLQQPHEIAHDAHEAVLQGAPAAVVDLGAVVEHDEVDVAGIVELAGARAFPCPE